MRMRPLIITACIMLFIKPSILKWTLSFESGLCWFYTLRSILLSRLPSLRLMNCKPITEIMIKPGCNVRLSNQSPSIQFLLLIRFRVAGRLNYNRVRQTTIDASHLVSLTPHMSIDCTKEPDYPHTRKTHTLCTDSTQKCPNMDITLLAVSQQC